jgi:hypothetical protein
MVMNGMANTHTEADDELVKGNKTVVQYSERGKHSRPMKHTKYRMGLWTEL